VSRRLYRSRDDRVLEGVCGGLAKYFDIDPVIVRVIAVLSLFLGGAGLVAYVILALVVPLEGTQAAEPRDTIRQNVEEMKETATELGRDIRATVAREEADTEEMARLRSRRLNWLGIATIALGVVFLLGNLNVFWWFRWGVLWPILPIAIGVLLVIYARRK